MLPALLLRYATRQYEQRRVGGMSQMRREVEEKGAAEREDVGAAGQVVGGIWGEGGQAARGTGVGEVAVDPRAARNAGEMRGSRWYVRSGVVGSWQSRQRAALMRGRAQCARR